VEWIKQQSKNLWEINIPDKLKGILTFNELKILTNEALGKIYTESGSTIEIDKELKEDGRPANKTDL
jgi:hypothetical protein